MPTITVSESIYNGLASKAAEHNVSLEELVATELQHVAASPPPDRKLTRVERSRAFDEWQAVVAARAHRYPPGFQADCDRDTIYGDDRP